MSQRSERLRRPFFGWWIVGGTAVLATLSGGAYIHGFTAFVHWSYKRAGNALGAKVLVDGEIDHLGPRWPRS